MTSVGNSNKNRGISNTEYSVFNIRISSNSTRNETIFHCLSIQVVNT